MDNEKLNGYSVYVKIALMNALNAISYVNYAQLMISLGYGLCVIELRHFQLPISWFRVSLLCSSHSMFNYLISPSDNTIYLNSPVCGCATAAGFPFFFFIIQQSGLRSEGLHGPFTTSYKSTWVDYDKTPTLPQRFMLRGSRRGRGGFNHVLPL